MRAASSRKVRVAGQSTVCQEQKKSAHSQLRVRRLSPGRAEIRRYPRQPPAARKPAGSITANSLIPTGPMSASIFRQQSVRILRKWACRVLSSSRQALTQNKFLIGFSATCHRTQAILRAIPTRCLDTRRLIEFGEEAAGRDRLEAQMIIKNALGFIPAILASQRRR